MELIRKNINLLLLACVAAVSLFMIAPSVQAQTVTVNTAEGAQSLGADETILVTPTGSVTGGATGINGTSNNQATVQAGGTVTGTIRGIRWNNGGSVNNSGSISGTGFGSTGVQINGNSGSVTNNMGGSISGRLAGVALNAGGTVLNTGAINGTSITGAGVFVGGNPGYVLNNEDGVITGGLVGVNLDAGGSIDNYGTIQTTNFLLASGVLGDGMTWVNNYAGATIQSMRTGVLITGSDSGVYNNGDITSLGRNAITILGDYATVRNDTEGAITGYETGVYVGGYQARVRNRGDIIATDFNSIGVEISGDKADIRNRTSGTITAVGTGVSVVGNSAYLRNRGTIAATDTFGSGVYIGGNGAEVANRTTGTIRGLRAGVEVYGNNLYMTHDGTITTIPEMGMSTGGTAILVSGDNAEIINGTGSKTIGGAYGMSITGTDAYVATDGEITAMDAGGIGLFIDGKDAELDNLSSGVITGDLYGARIEGKNALVDNSGTLTGGNSMGLTGVGLQLNGAGATVYNYEDATIEGAENGVVFKKGGTLSNSGVIRTLSADATGTAVKVSDTMFITNNSTGDIYGNKNGIVFNDYGNLVNYGQISGITNRAVVFDGAGTADYFETNGGPNSMIQGGNGVAVAMGGGADTARVNYNAMAPGIAGLARVNGAINGGGGSDNLIYNFNGAGVLAAKQLLLQWEVFTDTDIVPTDLIFTVLGQQYAFSSFEDARYLIDADPFFEFGMIMGLTPNQQAIADFFDSVLFANDDLSDVISIISVLPESEIPEALNAVSPERLQAAGAMALSLDALRWHKLQSHFGNINSGVVGGIDTTGLQVNPSDGSPLLASYQNRLASIQQMNRSLVLSDVRDDAGFGPGSDKMKNRWGVFVSGGAVFADGKGNADISDFDYTTGIFMMGVDYRVTPTITLGAGFTYGGTDAHLDSIGSRTEADTYSFGMYGNWNYQGWYVNGSAFGGWNQYDQKRRIFIFPVVDETAVSRPNGQQYSLSLGTGHDFRCGNWTMGPAAGVNYTHLNIDSYMETGAGAFNLNVGEQQIDSLRSSLGFQVSYRVFDPGKFNFSVNARAFWQHEFFDDSRGITGSFSDASAGSFTVNTQDPERDWALVGIGFNGAISERISIFADYDVQVGQSNFIAHGISGGVRVGF